MMLSEYLKPAFGGGRCRGFGGGSTGSSAFPHAVEKETPGDALVIVTKSTNACFSDTVRVTGFFVPRREAVVGVDQEGSKVSELLVHEGDMVTDNRELARLALAAPGATREPRRRETGADLVARSAAAGRVTRNPHHCRSAGLAGGLDAIFSISVQATKSNSTPRYRPSTC